MNIALYNLEPEIKNSAMMQVAMYHRLKGDMVYLYDPNKQYDKIYAFSLFTFTDKSKVTVEMECGGTGFDIKKRLPTEIESCDYDWSLYSDCDYSMIWFSRGCIRHCPFCIVQDKEGYICPVQPKNLNPNGKYIKVMDNNFFANPKWREAIAQLKAWGQPVDFQGVDVRILTKEMCDALKYLKHAKQIHIAWDLPEQDLVPKLKEVLQWIKAYRFACYVYIDGTSPEKDLIRILKLKELGIDPFVMPKDKHDEYQSNMARYVNMKSTFKKVPWYAYKNGILTKWISKEGFV